MTFWNSTPAILLVLTVLTLGSCNGLSTKNHPPMVFALNLSAAPVSLALVRDSGTLVEFASIGPGESRPLTKVQSATGVVLRQGKGGETPSVSWTDPSGTPYNLRFQTGELYALVVDPTGQAAFYALPETYSDDPKLCVVNVLPTTLSQVQAAPDWAKNVKVYAQDLVPVVPSEFYSIEPKTLGLYWQTLDQVSKGDHTTALGPDGRPLRQTFLSGHSYLFLAGKGDIRDLSPTID